MATRIYEIPGIIDELFLDVNENDGSAFYRIINNEHGMNMDNKESMQHFIDCVDIPEDLIDENLGTQITLIHADYKKRVTIDSGGLGDFFSHGFECSWTEGNEGND